MAEALCSYLRDSISETPVILRMTNGHPYGNMDLLRVRMIFCGGIAYIDVGTSIARPYGRSVVLLSGGFDIGNARHSRYVDKRRTLRRGSFASRLGWMWWKDCGGSKPPPYGVHLLRVWTVLIGEVRDVEGAVPYGGFHLLRGWMGFIGEIAAGAFLGGDASPSVTS